MPILYPNRQIAAQRETSEASQVAPGSFTAADLIQVIDPQIRPIANSFERPLAARGFGTNPDHFSTASVEVTFGVEVAGHRDNSAGSYTASPRWSRLLEACKWNRVDLYQLSIDGAISSGPLQHLETLQGGVAGDSKMLGYGYSGEAVIPVTGAAGGPGGSPGGAPTSYAAGEAVTGAVSGGGLTTPDPIGAGFDASTRIGDAWYPITTEVENKTLTFLFNIDGQRYQVYGSRGNVTINFQSHDRVVMQFKFMGIFDEADAATALDELAADAFKAKNPPGLLAAQASFVTDKGSPETLSGQAFCWSQATLEAGNNVVMRDCANGANGYQAAVIANRDPRFNINPDDPGVATLPFVANMLNGIRSRYSMLWGTTAGNQFQLKMPYLQTADLTMENREERSTWQASYKVTRGIDDGADEATIGQDNEILLLHF